MPDNFVQINTDLHIHGPYSSGVSEKMSPEEIARVAPLKGLHLIGTGDILNENWIKIVQQQLQKTPDEGIFSHQNGTKFVLQTEICDNDRIHHLILFPSLSKVQEVREKFRPFCTDLDKEGRPSIHLSASEIAEICVNADCLLGFAHAFTPYFGLFAKHDSYKSAYGSYADKVYFMELGLSADTDMADRISELHGLTFTSNSDGHSPWPNKLGREFTTFAMKEIAFEELRKALKREAGRKAVLNVKFNPLEGKYHKTRCCGCLTFFEPQQAEDFGWRCPQCGDAIKKGVDCRIEELSDLPIGRHPEHRPACLHIIPLSEIISLATGIKNAWSNSVQQEWTRFVEKFGTEINALINADIEELAEVNKDVATYIGYFRDNKIKYVPGGAGVFGQLVSPGQEVKLKTLNSIQKSLADF